MCYLGVETESFQVTGCSFGKVLLVGVCNAQIGQRSHIVWLQLQRLYVRIDRLRRGGTREYAGLVSRLWQHLERTGRSHADRDTEWDGEAGR